MSIIVLLVFPKTILYFQQQPAFPTLKHNNRRPWIRFNRSLPQPPQFFVEQTMALDLAKYEAGQVKLLGEECLVVDAKDQVIGTASKKYCTW